MNDFILYVLDYIDLNILRDVSIDELSLYFGYDKSYLMKKFKSELGISIKTYVNNVRIFNSLNMLNSDELLLKVALLNGFHSLEYYSETFSKVMGFSPSLWKKYLSGTLTKQELERVKLGLFKETTFRNTIINYRSRNKDNKVLRLEIPKEKKYVA